MTIPVWASTNATISASAHLGPRRTLNAAFVEFTGVNTGTLVQSSTLAANSEGATFSIWAKGAQGHANLYVSMFTSNINHEQGFVIGREWQQLYVTEIFPGGGIAFNSTVFQVDAFDTEATSTGPNINAKISDGGEGGIFYFAEPQLENAAQFTHYVPTGGNPATADRPGFGLAAAGSFDGALLWDDPLTWDQPSVLTGTYITEEIDFNHMVALRFMPETRFFDPDGTFEVFESRALKAPPHQVDSSFSQWAILGPGDAPGRSYRFKAEMTAVNSDDNPRIDMMRLWVDGALRDFATTLSILPTGTTLTFQPPFLEPPDLIFSAADTFYAIVTSVTQTRAWIKFFNLNSTTIAVSGQAVVRLRGL